MTNRKLEFNEFGSVKTTSQIEDIVGVQGINSNSSRVSQHNQVAATSANSLSRLIAD